MFYLCVVLSVLCVHGSVWLIGILQFLVDTNVNIRLCISSTSINQIYI